MTALMEAPAMTRVKVLIAITDSAGRLVALHAAGDGFEATRQIMGLQREWGDGYTVGGFALGDFLAIHLRQYASHLDQAPLAEGANQPDEAERAFRAGRVSVADELRALAARWKGWQP